MSAFDKIGIIGSPHVGHAGINVSQEVAMQRFIDLDLLINRVDAIDIVGHPVRKDELMKLEIDKMLEEGVFHNEEDMLLQAAVESVENTTRKTFLVVGNHSIGVYEPEKINQQWDREAFQLEAPPTLEYAVSKHDSIGPGRYKQPSTKYDYKRKKAKASRKEANKQRRKKR